MRDRCGSLPFAERPARTARGFTLVELIVTIVLIGALAGVSAIFIVQPFEANEDLKRRAALVDATDQALDRITRDTRRSLPNSLRAEHEGHVEFLALRTAGRYRCASDPDDPDSQPFEFADRGTFDVLGSLLNAGDIEADDVALDDCATGEGDCLSVYNLGRAQAGFDAYQKNNIASVGSETDETQVEYDTEGSGFDNRLNPQCGFDREQEEVSTLSGQRFYIFEEVVSYVCTDNDTLMRYTGYGLKEEQPSSDTLEDDDDAEARLVADNVTDCKFNYTAGAGTRRGLLTIELGLSRGGETVNLLDQAQVPNAP